MFRAIGILVVAALISVGVGVVLKYIAENSKKNTKLDHEDKEKS